MGAVKAPMNLSLLLLPSKVSALQSVQLAHPPEASLHPDNAPVMAPVQASTSAVSTDVYSTTPVNHLLVLEGDNLQLQHLDICRNHFVLFFTLYLKYCGRRRNSLLLPHHLRGEVKLFAT